MQQGPRESFPLLLLLLLFHAGNEEPRRMSVETMTDNHQEEEPGVTHVCLYLLGLKQR